ncbi:hypothetical protein H5U35_02585 [Candidatus Aerophobetes bacterium]|nr:hypothetical protein [Candidatus Aerophobetes bacterium]
MVYIEEFFSVSFEGEEKIENNPVPYGRICRKSTEKTRYVGIARIRRFDPQIYRLEGVTVIILPGRDPVTEEKRRKVMLYARNLAARRYARILKGNFPIDIDSSILNALQDADIWMPSKFMTGVQELVEDILSL